MHWVSDMTRGLVTLAGRIGSGVIRPVLDIVTVGGGVTRFLLSISATLMTALFALVPIASLLFRPHFLLRVSFLLFVAVSRRLGVRNTTVQRLPTEVPGALI